MVQWHSPEEAEAWWAEFQNLKQKVSSLEDRLIDIAKDTYVSSISNVLDIVRIILPAKVDYIKKRTLHYSMLIHKSNNEKDMKHHRDQFFEEMISYLKSG